MQNFHSLALLTVHPLTSDISEKGDVCLLERTVSDLYFLQQRRYYFIRLLFLESGVCFFIFSIPPTLFTCRMGNGSIGVTKHPNKPDVFAVGFGRQLGGEEKFDSVLGLTEAYHSSIRLGADCLERGEALYLPSLPEFGREMTTLVRYDRRILPVSPILVRI